MLRTGPRRTPDPGPAPEALWLVKVSRTYGTADSAVTALDGVTLVLGCGTFTAVMGPPGSGKSTLLQCAAGLDRPDSGIVRVGGTELTGGGEAELTRFRRGRIGFVFQQYNLLETLTVAQDAVLPLKLAGRRVPPLPVPALDFPDEELERRIVRLKVPGIDAALAASVVRVIGALRAMGLRKAPSVAETIDWARTLLALGAETLDETAVRDTLGVLLKHQDDVLKVCGRTPPGRGVNTAEDVAARLTGLVGALRSHGVRVGTGETVDAARALEALGFADRELLREALAATLLHTSGQRSVFDAGGVDVSGSVSGFSDFTMLLVQALHDQLSKVRVFAFVNRIDE
ncbi:hypothetical protein GCM10027072_66680 [Streptomyces bullii]